VACSSGHFRIPNLRAHRPAGMGLHWTATTGQSDDLLPQSGSRDRAAQASLPVVINTKTAVCSGEMPAATCHWDDIAHRAGLGGERRVWD